MLYREFTPHPALRDHVKCFWTLTVAAPPPGLEGLRVLADGVELAFNLADPFDVADTRPGLSWAPRDRVWGPMTHPVRVRPTGRVEVFGVCFRPGGAYPFFSYPAVALADEGAEVGVLWGASGEAIVGRIEGARHTGERIRLVEQELLQRLAANGRGDARVAAALRLIDGRRGMVPIDEVARTTGLSGRQLERHFRERVGMTPKQLCRSLRFKNVLRHLARGSDSWASTALACGYCDQSHLIRDFKHFTGTSPAAFFTPPVPPFLAGSP
jgi:AraC-like DNA-binding protein